MIPTIKNTFILLLAILFCESAFSQAFSSLSDTGFNYDEQFALASSMHKKGKDNEAVKIHYAILDYLQKHDDGSETYYTRLAENYQHLTNLYVFENDSLSLMYANKAIAAAGKTNSIIMLERSYSFKYYCLYNVPGSAEQLDAIADSCIKYSLMAKNDDMLGEAYMHKCNALVELGKIEVGDKYCLKAEKIFMETDTGYFLSAVLGNIANVFIKSNQLEKALSYHLKSYSISRKLDNLNYMLTDVQNLAEDYYKIGNYKQSAEYYKMLADSMEASYKNKLDEKFTDSEAKFSAEQKDKEIALQKLEIEQRKKGRDRIIFGSLLVLLLVAGFFRMYIFKQKKKKQQAEHELRKEQEINNMRKSFLENIAHEIRTPITLINGYLELALEDGGNMRKHIKSAMSNNNKVLSNANEIFELLKLESGKIPLANSRILLDSFLKRVFFSFESLAYLKKIELKYNSGIKAGLAINSDKARIEKILDNFISNAIKFSPSGTQIVFDAKIEEGMLTLKVTDSGPGIPSDEQQKIFERFYQSANADKVGGMGIGLSLANELAVSLGGRIALNSKTGKGSAFSLIMKVEAYESGQEEIAGHIGGEDDKPDVISINPDSKKRILIVEDNPEMNAYIKEILCTYYSCDIAFDGAEGLQKIQTRSYSLVISDVMMPKLDGFGLKQKINKLEKHKNTPFVFLTAKAQLSNRIEGFNLGVDDYIAKPFSGEELITRISALIKNKTQRDGWAKDNPDFVGDDKNSEEALLEKIKAAVRENISDENFKVEMLAEEVAYSSRQLSRLTKKLSGLTPLQFVLEMRLQRAYAYLTEKKFSTLAELRNSVGMPAAAHFNKKFTERFGIRPTDVLNKN